MENLDLFLTSFVVQNSKKFREAYEMLFSDGSDGSSESEVERQHRVRTQNYVELIVPRYNDNDFKSHFRMSRSTFEVCNYFLITTVYYNFTNIHLLYYKKFNIFILIIYL